MLKELVIRFLLSYIYRKVGSRIIATNRGSFSLHRIPDWELIPYDWSSLRYGETSSRDEVNVKSGSRGN